MYRFFQRLVEPTPTSPFNPYGWGQVDNRTVGEKVASGLRLGGGLIGGFLVLVLALSGLSTLPAGASAYGRYGLVFSYSAVCIASMIMFLTANRWGPYVSALFCMPAIFKSLVLLLLGPNPRSSIASNRVSRADAAEILILCFVVITLTWRFVGNTPAQTTLLDRLALTFFVLASLEQTLISYRWPPLLLILGLSALFVAWCVYRWDRAKTKRRNRHDSSALNPSEIQRQ